MNSPSRAYAFVHLPCPQKALEKLPSLTYCSARVSSGQKKASDVDETPQSLVNSAETLLNGLWDVQTAVSQSESSPNNQKLWFMCARLGFVRFVAVDPKIKFKD